MDFDYCPVYELFSGALLRRLREGRFGGKKPEGI
jgi:hypothetical protein